MLCIEIQPMSVFLDVTKVADFWSKTADGSRGQCVCVCVCVSCDLYIP